MNLSVVFYIPLFSLQTLVVPVFPPQSSLIERNGKPLNSAYEYFYQNKEQDVSSN